MKYKFLVVGLLLVSVGWSSLSAQIIHPVTVDFCEALPEGPFEEGNIVEVPIIVTGFTNLTGVRVPIVYNSSMLEYVGNTVLPLAGDSFSVVLIGNPSSGFFMLDWVTPSGQGTSLVDNSAFVSLRFEVLSATTSLQLSVAAFPIPIFVYSTQGEVMGTACSEDYFFGPLCPSPGFNCIGSNVQVTMLYDSTSECSPIDDPNPMVNWRAHFEQIDGLGYFSSTTNIWGNGFLALPPGIYHYYWEPPGNPDYWNICTGIDTIQIEEVDTLISICGQARAAITDCSETYVSISSGPLRPCFSANQYWINYGNYGPIVAEDAYIDVYLSPLFTPNFSSLDYSVQADGAYRFMLGDLEVGASGFIRMRGHIDCDLPVGSALCSTVSIYPNEQNCITPSPLFAGAELVANSECLGEEIQFNVTNQGTGPSGEVGYTLIEDDLIIEEETLNLAANASTSFNVPATGSTYRLEVDLPLDAPYLSQALAIQEGCGNGPLSLGFVTALPLLDDDLWLDRYCQETTAAYDPNDKQAIPKGVGDNQLIAPNTTVDYKIRFQNTGNDTAFTVIIRDTINTEVFDLSTLELGAASHDFFLRQTGGNALEFVFNNIQLPDSTIDEPGSHGYVHFSIAQWPDLPDGTLLSNRAGIYFDFNPPIITNESWHIVGRNLLSTSVHQFKLTEGPVTIYPNPFSSGLQFEHADWPGPMTFELFDQLGRQLYTAELLSNGSQLDLPFLPSGTYQYRLIHVQQIVQTGMLIKN